MVKRKYQVFISSTQKDLVDERLKVFEAVLDLGCIPVGMENFYTGEKSWDIIKSEIQESDIYLLITAGCYGSLVRKKGKNISCTEIEYDYAKELGKTVLVFVVKDIETLPRSRTDDDLTNIRAFHKKVKSCGDNVRFWTDINSLVSEVKSSVGVVVKKKNTGGWIKIEGDIDDYQAEVIEEWGLNRIFKTRAEKNNESDSFLEKHSVKNLDGIAFGLRSFRSIRKKDIIECLDNGMNMRLLVMSPDSEYIKQRAKEEKEDIDSIAKSVRELIAWVDEVRKESKAGSIKIKVYDSMTIDFLWRIDDVVYVGPYLYGIPSQQTITFKYYKPGRGYKMYTDYFESLWNDSELCKNP